ncbi:MAG: aldo/keto reductase [Xanthomonadales bacterium]|nr:aldo/keto reductase [Xanthomonadales bacterium]
MQRRTFLTGSLAALGLNCLPARGAEAGPHRRRIPGKSESVPAIGMGTWITFDVGNDPSARAERVKILRRFFEAGGTLIDSSPMYGSAQAVVGHCLEELRARDKVFAATKVWVPGRERGIHQMTFSADLWGIPRFDLMQVHNLVDWQTHLRTLDRWRSERRVRHVGVTTSHGRRHAQLQELMRTRALDFVQFTYNIADREAEARLLPMAAEQGIGVIVNRPFQTGGLFNPVRGRELPAWAGGNGCRTRAQVFLKFVISHPAVTCAIPATSRADHMAENMQALYGPLPDPALRERMVRYFEG